MRFYRLTPTRPDVFLRWFVFDRRRAWLDMEDPAPVVTLMLLGPGAAEARLELRDREGRSLRCDDLGPAQVPPGQPGFTNQPADQRRLLRLRLHFPGPEPVQLVRMPENKLLLTLDPVVNYPAPLFALMRESAARLGLAGFDNFIETGTLFGHTTLHASYWFAQVWTVELSVELHALACKTLAHRPNITCLQGNSGAVLPTLVPGLTGASLFYLDGHWSGDDSVDWGDVNFAGFPMATARLPGSDARPDTGPDMGPDMGPDTDTVLTETDRQVPLMDELRAIVAHHRGPAAIVIDDWRLFGRSDAGFAGLDWTGLPQQAVLDVIAAEPRTRFHFQANSNQYLWAIGSGE